MAAAFEPFSLSALDPAIAPVDGSSLRRRLAFAAQFARLVRFYTLDNRPEGDWQPFLLKDAAILLAAIADADYSGLHARYQALTADGNASPQALLELLHHMYATLAHWHSRLELQAEDFPLRAFLAQAVRERLASNLAHVRTLHQAFVLRGMAAPPDGEWHRSLGPDWQAAEGGDVAEGADGDIQALKRLCLETLDILIQTVDAAAGHFDAAASRPTPHPDTALLRVFADLMRHPQEVMNRIGARHLDFYYRRVLEIEPRPARPDRVVVFATPAAGQSCVAVPAGTRFAAGKDADGNPLWYANPAPAVVNTAHLAAAFGLRAVRVGEAEGRGFTAGIHAARLADLESLQTDAAGHPQDQAVFGTPAPRPAGLGFALASPMLLLQGGGRSILLTCELAEGEPPPEGWASGWGCRLSGADGWFEAGAYLFPPHWEPAEDGRTARLVLELSLPPDAPPVAAAAKPLDGRSCPWPQIRFDLPPVAAAHPWPRMVACGIEVKVRELGDLRLWNSLGPLAGAAAPLLGAVPQPGGRFFVGSPEIFAKPVDRLVLTLDWANLPPRMGDWYREYNQWQAERQLDWPPLEDGIHKGEWHWRQADGWRSPMVNVPPGNAAESLFQQAGGRSVFTFRFGPEHRPAPSLAQGDLPPPQEARAGWLAFTLRGPPQGFGHGQYPQVLVWSGTRQAAHLMQPTAAAAPPPGIPNPPLTPLLKSASAEYGAACRLVPGADAGHPDPEMPCQWVHYGPWHNWIAWQSGQSLPSSSPLDPAGAAGGLTPVPRVAGAGCLLLAVEALPTPCSLRLHACVTEEGDGEGIEVRQYGADGWRPAEVLRDDSRDLSGDGLLEVAVSSPAVPLLPEPAGCTWLAISPRGGWRASRLALLASQAIPLERVDLAPQSPRVAPLAPGAIAKPPIPQLATVRQPLASQGGRGAEDPSAFQGANSYHQRVARRLLHKGRALTHRDFVLLAREVMPDLFLVEPLPPTPESQGEVRLGVVPAMAGPEVAGAFRPRLAAGERMRLASVLQGMSAGGLRVSVLNPALRSVTLAAEVMLAPEALAAWPVLRRQWNLELRLYLSPWIGGDSPRYDPRGGLTRAGVLQRLCAFPGLLSVKSLTIRAAGADGISVERADDPLVPPPQTLWVSADEHLLVPVGE